MVQAARAVAANTPMQLAAAQQSETQARARTTRVSPSIAEIADAQSLLAQAEVQDQSRASTSGARCSPQAVARGDLGAFVRAPSPLAGHRPCG